MTAVLALTFHGVSPELLPPGLRAAPTVLRYTLSPETLERILNRLRPEICCTPAGLEQVSDGNFVALTFDDGFSSDFEVVFPALISRGLKAAFFVTAENAGREGYVTWDQLRAMSSAGMEIGSHGLTHRDLVSLRPEEVRREIRHSREILEQRLGIAVASFAPVGGHHARWMVDEARSAGYRVFSSTVPGRTVVRPGMLFLRRNYVQAHHGEAHFERLLQGDGLTFFGIRARYEVLSKARRMLGARVYDRIRLQLLHGVLGQKPR